MDGLWYLERLGSLFSNVTVRPEATRVNRAPQSHGERRVVFFIQHHSGGLGQPPHGKHLVRYREADAHAGDTVFVIRGNLSTV